MNATGLDAARLSRRRRRARRAGAGDGVVFVDLPDCLLRARVVAKHPPSRPTVVIQPDAPNAIEHYGELIERLGESVNVVCIEAAGSGFSFPKRGYDFSVERIATALRSALERIDLAPYVLIAPCGGAYGSIQLANGSPELVAGLAIVQAPAWEEEKRWIGRIDSAGLISRPVIGQAICAVAPGRLSDTWYSAALGPDAQHGAFKATSRRLLKRGGCFCLASLIQANRNAEMPLRAVEQPALIVWGQQDRTHSRTDKRSSLGLAPGARYVEFEDAGHSPDLERVERFAGLALELAEEASGALRSS